MNVHTHPPAVVTRALSPSRLGRGRKGSRQQLRAVGDARAHTLVKQGPLGGVVGEVFGERERAEARAEAVVLVDAQWVRLGVEDVLVQRHLRPVSEEQPEVLERLREEEGLHLPVVPAAVPVRHVLQPRVAAVLQPAEPLEGHEDVPPPVAVLFVACDPPQDKERLDRLGAQQVVPRAAVGGHAARPLPQLGNLGRETRRLVRVHAVARLHQLLRERHRRASRRAAPHAVDARVRSEREHAGHKADQVVHLVLVPLRPKVPPADVCAVCAARQPALPDEMRRDGRDRLGVHLRHAAVGAAAHQPLLEQVLVERVRERAHRHLGRRPAERLRRHKVWVQAGRLRPAAHVADLALRDLPKLLAAGVVREVLELELDGPKLGQDCVALRPRGEGAPARPVERDGGAGHARLGVGLERVHHQAGQLLRLAEEHRLARQLKRREQPADDPDHRLKHRDAHCAAEAELGRNPLLGLVKLGLEPEDPQIVEAVDHRRAQVQPVVRLVADWLDLIHAPRVLPVRPPRALERAAHRLQPHPRQRIGRVHLRLRPSPQRARRQPRQRPARLGRGGGGGGGGDVRLGRHVARADRHVLLRHHLRDRHRLQLVNTGEAPLGQRPPSRVGEGEVERRRRQARGGAGDGAVGRCAA
mmetsp:Transcript_36166/g.109008  ORF Transcript_36166/g.109008 Transcript_36166/m.109008 type:complete len:642 (-) Transcript_36166:964-2889(-)